MQTSEIPDKTQQYYKNCRLCPRFCEIDRTAGQRGFCGQGDNMAVAFAGLHFGEEPVLVRKGGSGTIFFSGCTLACSFCQNWQISHCRYGKNIGIEEFADICLELQNRGAENINLVSGTHFIPSIVDGLALARERGLNIPRVWNTSSWESEEGLALLAGSIDIYLPDIKTFDRPLAQKLFKAGEYPNFAIRAIEYMAEQGPFEIDGQTGFRAMQATLEEDSVQSLKKGLILRHLILPERIEDTANILKWFKRSLHHRALISIMTQYTPVGDSGKIPSTRFLEIDEYNMVQELLDRYSIDLGFFQEFQVDSEWLPDFTRPKPFGSELCIPVWHYLSGFVQ